MLSLPAKLAGISWNKYILDYRYYGYGFVILCTPLFRIIKSPIVLYKVILILYTVVSCLCGPILYKIIRKVVPDYSNKIIGVIVGLFSYVSVTPNTFLYNDNLYFIFVLLTMLVLLDLVDKENKSNIYTVQLCLLFQMALSFHQRAVTLLFGTLIIYVVYLWVYKKRLFNLPLYITTILVLYYFNSKIVNQIVNYILGGTILGNTYSNQQISNTSAFSGVINNMFFSVRHVLMLSQIVLSQVINFNIKYYGLFFLVLVSGFFILYKIIINTYKRDTNIQVEIIDKYYMVIFGFSVSCILITSIARVISWGPSYVDAINHNDYNNEHIRVLFYYRYAEPYINFLVISSLICFFHYKEVVYRVKYIFVFGSIILFSIWFKTAFQVIRKVDEQAYFFKV